MFLERCHIKNENNLIKENLQFLPKLALGYISLTTGKLLKSLCRIQRISSTSCQRQISWNVSKYLVGLYLSCNCSLLKSGGFGGRKSKFKSIPSRWPNRTRYWSPLRHLEKRVNPTFETLWF